jgi:hypothetical protein
MAAEQPVFHMFPPTAGMTWVSEEYAFFEDGHVWPDCGQPGGEAEFSSDLSPKMWFIVWPSCRLAL